MKMCDVHLAVLLLVLVVDIVMAQHNSSSAQRYCGSKLADVLKVLCKTKYYEMTTKKPKKRDRIGEFNKKSPASSFPPRRLSTRNHWDREL